MNLDLVGMAMAVGANVSYHLFMKATPSAIHPLAALLVTYLVGAATCALLLPFFVKDGVLLQVSQVNWAPVGLGVSIVFLELGFMLAYRAGWNIATAAIVANVTVGLLLLPIGIISFKERLTLYNGVGFLVAMLGLYLLGKR